MKLSEIIEPVSFNKQLNRPFDSGYISKSGERNHKRPSGYFSHISNSKDPQMVIKSPNYTSEKNFNLEKIDGFTHFAKWVIKTKINQSNPYFPRIYTKTKIQDSDGRFVTRYEMEKLIPYSSINLRMLYDYTSALLKHSDGYDGGFNSFVHIILRRVESGNGGTKIFKDTALIEACQWVKEHQGNFDLDFHKGNFMFRRTNFGIQLVFSDPYGSNITGEEDAGNLFKDIQALKRQGF